MRLQTAEKRSLVIFHVIFLLILLINFPFGKYYLGWDSLTPEFNFSLNFQRALFSSWQENYGTGTLTGHGFAATLPHTMITYILSLLLPLSAIRTGFTFLMLYLGGLGIYFLITMLLKKYPVHENVTSRLIPYTALIASLFYMLNLGTVQMFYVQLEPYIAHFAFLPWIFLLTILLLENLTAKRLLTFGLISFFGSIQGFIPSLFASYALGLSLLLTVFVIAKRASRDALKKTGIVLSLIFLTNSFWMSAILVYTRTQNNTFLSSYNNLMSTPHFIDVNKKYGGIHDVALLKGFLFESFQLGDYVLRPWIDHLSLFLPQLIGYLFFLFILFGFMLIVKYRINWIFISFGVLFIFFFSSLATNAPPFSYLTNILQVLSPTFAQAFRTSFTKFSIGGSFTYSILLGIGIYGLLNAMSNRFSRQKMHSLLLGIGTLLLLYALPVFQGNLLYSKLKITVPASYFSVMDFFKTQSDGRIADFPQECADGWYSYKWGYFGSGFYWYGVKQPFLSRSFDVWGDHNEGYYWEITQALHQEDFGKATRVLNKYNVRFVLYDPNAYYCNNQKGVLIHKAFIAYLKNSPDFTLKRTIKSEFASPILIFENKNAAKGTYISTHSSLKNIGPISSWNDDDTAYHTEESYITNDEYPYDSYYPFRSLFTKRGDDKEQVIISRENKTISLHSTLPQGLSGYMFRIKAYKDIEDIIPATITLSNTTPRLLSIQLRLVTPKITLDEKTLWNRTAEITLGTINEPASGSVIVKINGQHIASDAKTNDYNGVLFTSVVNTIDITDATNNLIFHWNSKNDPAFTTLTTQEEVIAIPSYKNGELRIQVQEMTSGDAFGAKFTDQLTALTPMACNEIIPSKRNKFEQKPGTDGYLVLSSQESNQCVNLYFPKLLTSLGYLVDVDAENNAGNNLKVSIYHNTRAVYGPHYLGKQNQTNQTMIFLPPTQKNGIGYDMQFINSSESSQESINTLRSVKVSYIPYIFLKNIRLARPDNLYPLANTEKQLDASHPSDTNYAVDASFSPKAPLLTLYQSFHPGWKAYVVNNKNQKSERKNVILSEAKNLLPFLFGTELKEHVLVNNWANGWILPERSDNKDMQSLRIIFLPQLIVFGGYIVTILTLLFLILKVLLRRRKAADPESTSS